MRKLVCLVLCFLTACTTVENSAFSPLYFGPGNISVGDAKLKVRQYMRENTKGSNIPMQPEACKSLGIYSLQVKPENYPYNSCLMDADVYYSELRKEIDAKEEAEKQAKQMKRQQEEIENEKIEKKQKLAKEEQEKRDHQKLVSDLKSGIKQPSTGEEVTILYDANDGAFLASSPKIKPDNNYYSFSGMINYMESDNVFVAQLLTDKRYFKVRIPENMKNDFEKTAKVNGWFGVVGKYTQNSDVLLVLFQSIPVPVLDAVYFKAVNFNEN